MTPRPRVLALLTVVLALALPRAAGAAPRATLRDASDGVDRVYHDYSGEGDASSLELNPALLSTIRGIDLTLLGYRVADTFMRGQGFGGFAAFGFGFGLAMGFGVQFVDPGFARNTYDYAAARNPPFTKVSWGLSAGLGTRGAIGFALHGLRGDRSRLRAPDLDIGLMARATNYVSLGANVRFGPAGLSSTTLPSQLSLVAEVAVRPLGTHHVEIAGGLRQILLAADPREAPENVGLDGLLPRGRLSLRYQGWAVRGEVEQVRLVDLERASLEPLRTTKGVRGSVSLEASWDFVSVGAGVHAGASDSAIDGVGFHARVHSRRRGRVFWPRRIDAERLELGEIDDEREFIALLQRIDRAREAGRRSVLVVDARDIAGGWATLHELREALARVRNAGGHVYAIIEDASLRDYYVASVAERVFMHPAGSLDAFGVASTTVHFREILDRIGVRAEVLKIDEYKSAGESFTETGPSEADRKQRAELYGDIFSQVVYDIARARGRTIEEVRAMLDDAPYGPDKALAEKWVDDVSFRDEVLGAISDELGTRVEYATISQTQPEDPYWAERPYIAVVLVEDTIIDGESRNIPLLEIGFTGGDTIAATLQKLRKDRACQGIVLRVDSGGGSALASDVIWREVERTHQAWKDDPRARPPIVVSFGDVAASGGYYLAVGAGSILSDPLTITGSIGVIANHWDISGLLGKLGIRTASIEYGKNANFGAVFAPWSDDERARVQASIRRTYDLFRTRVADGRDLTREKVDEIGRGHVYSGRDAKELALVDGFGGFLDAVALVRKQAGVRKTREIMLRVLPEERTLLQVLLDNIGDPFAGRGPVRKAVARREARRKRAELREAMPMAIDKTLARLPLSLLYLPQDRAQAVLDWSLDD